jgi:hypothetical protein
MQELVVFRPATDDEREVFDHVVTTALPRLRA